MADYKGIQLDDDLDLVIKGGSFAVGEVLDQEVEIVLRLGQGQLKSDSLLGPNLVRLSKSNYKPQELISMVSLHLKRDGKRVMKISVVDGQLKLKEVEYR